MAAGISLMYKISGGCDYKHRCAECGLFHQELTGKHIRYYCKGHPFGGDNWKPDLLACESFTDGTKELKLKEEENGQVRMFL